MGINSEIEETVIFNDNKDYESFRVVTQCGTKVLIADLTLTKDKFEKYDNFVTIHENYVIFGYTTLGCWNFDTTLCNVLFHQGRLQKYLSIYSHILICLRYPTKLIINPMGFNIKSNFDCKILYGKDDKNVGCLSKDRDSICYYSSICIVAEKFTLEIDLNSDVNIIYENDNIYINNTSIFDNQSNYYTKIATGNNKYLTFHIE